MADLMDEGIVMSEVSGVSGDSAVLEDAPLRVAVVVGSVREGRAGRAVTDWFLGIAEQHGGWSWMSSTLWMPNCRW